MYLIVGLGNPGEKYTKTFHNMGFLAVDDLAVSLGTKFTKNDCKALIAEARLGAEKVLIAKPQTFMNLSGESVSALMNYYKITPDKLIVIYDDVDLEKGSLRIRKNGSAGTHNGMRNIVAMIGTDEFTRIRVGTHDKTSPLALIDYVLSEIRKEDYPLFSEVLTAAANAAKYIAMGEDFDSILRKYNRTVK